MAIKASATISIFRIKEVVSTTNYYLLQSSTASVPSKPTTDTPSGWSTTEPTYVEGSTNTLYTTIKTKYSDNTFEYTPVSKSTSYEASKIAYNKAVNANTIANNANDKIDNLEIGGRNLLLKTNNGSDNWNYLKENGVATKETYETIGVYFNVTEISTGWQMVTYKFDKKQVELLEPNTQYMLSFDYKTNMNTTSASARIVQSNGKNTLTELISTNIVNDLEWHNAKFILTTNDLTNSKDNQLIYIVGFNKIGDLYIKNLKLEKGNKATDWTPAPEDTDSSINEVNEKVEKILAESEIIVGTQTTATATWTGKASFDSLKDGQQILYWLPTTSASNATLNLTLSSGTTTGAKNIYYGGTTRLGTHYPAGNIIRMIYRENVSINNSSTKYTGWWCDANYDSNTTCYLRFQQNIKVLEAITAGQLLGGTATGYKKIAKDVSFDLDKPILYAGTTLSANAMGNNNYISYNTISLRTTLGNSTWTATQYETLYLIGTMERNTFTPKEPVFTTTKPTEESENYYISLGYMYSTHQMILYPEHPVYKFVNGEFKSLNQVSYEAQMSSNNAIEIGLENQINISNTSHDLADVKNDLADNYYNKGEIDSKNSELSTNIVTVTNKLEKIESDTESSLTFIENVKVNGIDRVTTSTGYTFNQDGLMIDKSTSKTKNILDDKGMTITDKTGSENSELLFAGYDDNLNETIVRTKNISVSKYLSVGSHLRIEDYEVEGENSGTGFFYIG